MKVLGNNNAEIQVYESKAKITKALEVNGTITGTNLASDNETRLAALEAKMDALDYVLRYGHLFFADQQQASTAASKIATATGGIANIPQQINVDDYVLYII